MGAWKNRLILLAMMLALPLAGLVFFGILTEHNFQTLPYYTREGAVEGRSLDAQRVGHFSLTNQDGEAFPPKHFAERFGWLPFLAPMPPTSLR